jgi:hypothetical protein
MTDRDLEETQRSVCDRIIARAAEVALEESSATVPMLLDRLLTFAVAQAVAIDGSARTARNFRSLADTIDSGVFDHLTPDAGSKH